MFAYFLKNIYISLLFYAFGYALCTTVRATLMLYKIIYNESIFLYIFLFHISLLYYFMDLTDNSEIFLCFFAITFILLFLHILFYAFVRLLFDTT